MATIVNYPIVAFLLSVIVLWLSAQLGAFIRSKLHPVGEDEWKDLRDCDRHQKLMFLPVL